MITSERMPQNHISNDSFSRSRKEIDGLLKLAEELQEKCDLVSRRIEQARFFQVGCVAISLSSIGAGLWVNMSINSFSRSLLAGTILISILYAVASEYLIRRIKRRSEPDKAALAEVVELLRETGNGIAEAENWSALDRAEFRIRLSRFGIGHTKYKSYM
jgi:hypothetical protein